MNQAVTAPAGWLASLQLEFAAGKQKTLMLPQQRIGPLLVQRPFYPEGDCCHAYLIHPPGGVVGGDQLRLKIDCAEAAHALLTTPGATKFYQSAGQIAEFEQTLQVGNRGMLEYLPHENIFFPGARVALTTRIDLQPSAITMAWEKYCFGRPVIAECFDSGHLLSRLQVYLQGKLLLTETQRIDSEEIARSSGLRGYPVMGTFLMYGEAANEDLQQLLLDLPVQQGVAAITRPCESLLVLRYLGGSTADMHRYFTAAWLKARPVLTGKPAVEPRIWAT